MKHKLEIVLAAVAGMLLSSAVSAHDVQGANSAAPTSTMSAVGARQLINRALAGEFGVKRTNFFDGDKMGMVTATSLSADEFDVTFLPRTEFKCKLKSLDDIHIEGSRVIFTCGEGQAWLRFLPVNNSLRDRIADALRVLASQPVSSPPDQDPAFQKVADAYRNASIKPALAENARIYEVQAEGAIASKQFGDAADLYGKALELAPWWPEGHFNRALVLSELDEFAAAVDEMQRYLALVPNAQDARAAQDKIYIWQREASQTKQQHAANDAGY